MQGWNVAPEHLRHYQQLFRVNQFVILKNNAEAVLWFTQHGLHLFKVGFSGLTGLDYGQVKNAMSLEGMPKAVRKDMFWRIRAIADGVLKSA